MEIRPIIKAHCKLQGMTQKELANKIGMKENTLNVAIGKSSLNIAQLEKIATALNLSVSELMAAPTEQNQHAQQTERVSQQGLFCPHCGKPLALFVRAEETDGQ